LTPRIFKISKKEADQHKLSSIISEITAKRPNYTTLVKSVSEIVEDVRKRGDKALLEYVERFDKAKLSVGDIRVDEDELERAYEKIDKSLRKSLETAAENIKNHARKMLRKLKIEYTYKGAKVSLIPQPIESVGCYIPAGAAAYPSTALMTTIPPKIAGVKRIAATTPTYKREKETTILAALKIAGIEEVYRVGGPQAIAALAYGTETIKPVRKIVGPGGAYVTAAKLCVAGFVAVDMPAGPTELVVLCDGGVDVRDVVLELCAQAEHSADTMVGVITTSEAVAEGVVSGMEAEIPRKERRDVIRESWERNGFVVVCDDMRIGVQLVNMLAPEHVAVFARNASKIAYEIKDAGLVSVGIATSPVLCDYAVGVNHVLPTGGFAKVRGGLSVLDFIHLTTYVNLAKPTARKLAKQAYPIALAEELTAHAEALRRLA